MKAKRADFLEIIDRAVASFAKSHGHDSKSTNANTIDDGIQETNPELDLGISQIVSSTCSQSNTSEDLSHVPDGHVKAREISLSSELVYFAQNCAEPSS